MVNMGQAEYSCLCRFSAHGDKKATAGTDKAGKPKGKSVNDASICGCDGTPHMHSPASGEVK
jgi:hypothetical protein